MAKGVDRFTLQWGMAVENKAPRLVINGFVFTASMKISREGKHAQQKTTPEGALLWAIPGGTEATEGAIRAILRMMG